MNNMKNEIMINDVLRCTIKNAMNYKDMSICKLSKISGVSKATISRFLSGKSKDISFNNAFKLLTNLDRVNGEVIRNFGKKDIYMLELRLQYWRNKNE